MDRGAWWATVHRVAKTHTTERLRLLSMVSTEMSKINTDANNKLTLFKYVVLVMMLMEVLSAIIEELKEQEKNLERSWEEGINVGVKGRRAFQSNSLDVRKDFCPGWFPIKWVHGLEYVLRWMSSWQSQRILRLMLELPIALSTRCTVKHCVCHP